VCPRGPAFLPSALNGMSYRLSILLLTALAACGATQSGGAPSVSPVPPAPALPSPAASGLADTSEAIVPPLPSTGSDPDTVYQGWKLFHIHCFRCHGFDAEGGGAPDLRVTVRERLTQERFIATVLGGRPLRGMPSWAEVLNAHQAADIYLYVVDRSSGRLPPGPPPRS